LLPPAGSLLDVACGAGIVTARLAAGRSVVGIDRSRGMLTVAAARLHGRVLLGDAGRLPLRSGRFDAVLMIWLLHLLPRAEPALAEAVRVLAPGGRLVTTVDKQAAAPSDLASVTEPWRRSHSLTATDRFPLVAAILERHGLRPSGETSFPGTGQGRSPAAGSN
jgi:ubiquinone/menaquinone biosynthesis C-methylase UbiE